MRSARRRRGASRRPVVTQLLYNLLHRQLDIEYFAFARRYPIQTMAYNALAGGLLTGTAHVRGEAREGVAVRRQRDVPAPLLDARDVRARRAGARRWPRARGCTMVELAYAWLASRPGVDSILVGPATVAAPRRRARRGRAAALGGGRAPASTSCAREWVGSDTNYRARDGTGTRTCASRPPRSTSGGHRALPAARLGEARARRERARRSRACARGPTTSCWGGSSTRASSSSATRETGRYEDLVFGRGWEGPEPRIPEDREARARPRVPRVAGERGVRARRARGPRGRGRPLPRDAVHEERRRAGRTCPGTRTAASFWGLDRDPELQIWTALDDAPDRSGLRRGGRREPPRAASRRPSGARSRETRPRESAPTSGASPLPARAGEVLLIHNYLWHRSGRNTTGLPRRAFTVSYISGATRCTRRRRRPAPFVRVFGRSGVG